MRNENLFQDRGNMSSDYPLSGAATGKAAGDTLISKLSAPRQGLIGLMLIVALFAFELFNFDTTRFALADLLGDVSFLGMRWAAILAVAFCAIDFAGLAYLFTPERGKDEPKEVWYLMGAWLLGATMNALMTWWAMNLTLLNHQFGNEVLSREQLLQVVPPFVAVLVWLTRILFIGAFSVAGEHFFETERPEQRLSARPLPSRPALGSRQQATLGGATPRPAAMPMRKQEPQPERSHRRPPMPQTTRRAPRLSMNARDHHPR